MINLVKEIPREYQEVNRHQTASFSIERVPRIVIALEEFDYYSPRKREEVGRQEIGEDAIILLTSPYSEERVKLTTNSTGLGKSKLLRKTGGMVTHYLELERTRIIKERTKWALAGHGINHFGRRNVGSSRHIPRN